jgi:diaminopimelate decarboxylase
MNVNSERAVVAGPISSNLLPLTTTFADNGNTFVGGVDLVKLADQHGTPLFVYDEQHLRQRCRDAVTAFGSGVAYASKAFLCMEMAKLAHQEGMHIDVASAGEAFVALRAGVPAANLVLHGNNKSTAELTYALERGIGRIVVDSFEEITRLRRLGGFGHARCKVLLRLTPGVKADTHEFIATGQEDSKFGFSIKSGAAMEAVQLCRSEGSGVELVGVHCHVGSQVLDIDSYRKIVDVMAAFFLPLGLPELVIGGGVGVPYVGNEAAPSIAMWGAAVREAARRCGVSDAVKLSAEPGRSIVATAGLTLYRVGVIKDLPGIRTYVSVDGGMSDNPRPVMYDAQYEAFLPRNGKAERTKNVRIMGKHCESGDFLIKEAMVPEDVGVGDVLCTPVTGAYGYAMASNYNKLPRPAIVFVNDGSARVVVRRETYEDLLRLEVPS